jgi:hypothetical protein
VAIQNASVLRRAIARIDPRSNRVVKTFDLKGNDGDAYVKFGDGGLWVVSQATGRAWRIDLRDGTPRTG